MLMKRLGSVVGCNDFDVYNVQKTIFGPFEFLAQKSHALVGMWVHTNHESTKLLPSGDTASNESQYLEEALGGLRHPSASNSLGGIFFLNPKREPPDFYGKVMENERKKG